MNQPYIGIYKIGVCVFGRDRHFTAKTVVRSNLIRISDAALEEMNVCMFEKFAENPYEQKEALSSDDR